jgi:hypothetical protein
MPIKLVGEPVPGAEIYVELEPDDEPIMNNTTDDAGNFELSSLPQGTVLPETGHIQATVFAVIKLKPQKVIAHFDKKHGLKFALTKTPDGRMQLEQIIKKP